MWARSAASSVRIIYRYVCVCVCLSLSFSLPHHLHALTPSLTSLSLTHTHQSKSQHISSSREEDLSRIDLPATMHRAAVSCLMHSNHPRLVSGCPGSGLLFSGSKDGSVKCWESSGGMIQTLPHSSSVTEVADGKDGSLVSICQDGYLRLWSPQAGRNMLLHPFFECTHAVSVANPQETWLSALAVNPIGRWTCFIGEGEGSISLYVPCMALPCVSYVSLMCLLCVSHAYSH